MRIEIKQKIKIIKSLDRIIGFTLCNKDFMILVGL